MKKFISTLVLAFIVVVSTNVCSAVGSSYQDSEGIYYWIDNSSYIFFLFGNGQYGMSLAFDLNSIQVVRDDDYGFECKGTESTIVYTVGNHLLGFFLDFLQFLRSKNFTIPMCNVLETDSVIKWNNQIGRASCRERV